MTNLLKPRQLIRGEFLAGIKSSTERAEQLQSEADQVLTTLESFWLYEKCPVCSHTFRRGDIVQVTINPNGTHRVVHNSSQLACAGQQHQQPVGNAQIISQFLEGINLEYPPPQHINVIRLDPDNPEVADFLAPPAHGIQRRVCIVCGHTLRPNDHIVLCPCSPLAPGCMITLHRDEARSLFCWDQWQESSSTRELCPTYLARRIR